VRIAIFRLFSEEILPLSNSIVEVIIIDVKIIMVEEHLVGLDGQSVAIHRRSFSFFVIEPFELLLNVCRVHFVINPSTKKMLI
jgi:hypothetical protein